MMSLLCRPESLCRHLVCGLVVGLLLWGGLPPNGSAQQIHTLNIQGGMVYVDGRPLSEDQLPDSLNLEGIDAHYRFLGIQRPVVELKGRLFAVKDGLTPVTEEEVRGQRASVILGSGTTRRPARTAVSGNSPGRSETSHRQYLEAVQRSSRDLYERLLRERQMEQNARDLARAIRLLPKGEERRTKIDTLHGMLEEIFELKQENRRREIERLQQQIRELQRNLRRREQMREQMIDRRLRQLVDSTTQGR